MTAEPLPPLVRVLAAVDPAAGDDAAAREAGRLAGPEHVALHLLAVLDPLTPRELDRIARRTGHAPEEIAAGRLERARTGLWDLARRIGGTPPPTAEVRTGKPFVEIIRAVAEGDHDLVVKTAEELGGPLRHLLASTDQHLLRKCPAPVWLYRPDAGAPGPDRPVVAAVDVDPEEVNDPAVEAGLNRRIVGVALAIAARTGAPLRIVNAFEPSGEGLVRLYGGDGDEEAARYRDEVEREHWQALSALAADARDRLAASRLPAIPVSGELRRGRPREVIPAFVEEARASLLVMGTVARTGVPGLIIGNTAEDILNSLSVSVVAVTPPGYVSPLAAD